jgi:hypothetical protein
LLGKIGPDAKSAVSTLSQLRDSPEGGLRLQAAIALWRINHDTNVCPLLIAELDRARLPVSPEIYLALGEMGPAAWSAVPVLTERLENPQFNSFASPDSNDALDALAKIDSQAANEIRSKVRSLRSDVVIRQIDPQVMQKLLEHASSRQRPTNWNDQRR